MPSPGRTPKLKILLRRIFVFVSILLGLGLMLSLILTHGRDTELGSNNSRDKTPVSDVPGPPTNPLSIDQGLAANAPASSSHPNSSESQTDSIDRDCVHIKIVAKLPHGREPTGWLHFFWQKPWGAGEVYSSLADAIRNGISVPRPKAPGQLEVWHSYIPGLEMPPWDPSTLRFVMDYERPKEQIPGPIGQLWRVPDPHFKLKLDFPEYPVTPVELALEFKPVWYPVEFYGMESSVNRVYSTIGPNYYSGGGILLPGNPNKIETRQVWWDGHRDWHHYDLDLALTHPATRDWDWSGLPQLLQGPDDKWYVRASSIAGDCEPQVLELSSGRVIVTDGGTFDHEKGILRVSGTEMTSAQPLRFALECGPLSDDQVSRLQIAVYCEVLVFVRQHPDSKGVIIGHPPDESLHQAQVPPLPEGFASRVRVRWKPEVRIDDRRREAFISIPEGATISEDVGLSFSPIKASEAGSQGPDGDAKINESTDETLKVVLVQPATEWRAGLLRIVKVE